MPKIYLVCGVDYEEHTVLGAYLSEEKAAERYGEEKLRIAINRKLRKENPEDYSIPYIGLSYDIDLEEYDIID